VAEHSRSAVVSSLVQSALGKGWRDGTMPLVLDSCEDNQLNPTVTIGCEHLGTRATRDSAKSFGMRHLGS
jgi:hypothetical protein